MEVWIVYHEFETGDDESATWHVELAEIFSTEAKARAFIAAQPYNDKSHFTSNLLPYKVK